jgi:hypothetical protein
MKASREELLAMAEISEDEGSIDEQEGDIIEIHYNKDDDFLNVKTLSNKKDK